MSLEEPADTAGHAVPDLRSISDVRTLRALGHPVRIALIEELSLGGALTATQVGERIGESATTCSFHLRQLAKYGFVEEAGGGKGRARPWRMTSIGFIITASRDDPESELAANAVLGLLRERQLGRYQTWIRTRATYPPQWREAADESEYFFYLTAAELRQVTQDVADLLLARVGDRLTDPSKRPPGALPVELLLFSYPVAPPQETGETQPGAAGIQQ